MKVVVAALLPLHYHPESSPYKSSGALHGSSGELQVELHSMDVSTTHASSGSYMVVVVESSPSDRRE